MRQTQTESRQSLTPPLRERFALFALFFVPVTLFLGAILLYVYHQEERDAYHNHRVSVEQTLVSYAGQLAFSFGEAVSDMENITHGPALANYLRDGTKEHRDALAATFVAMEHTSGRYDHIRFIDHAGMEKVRVDYRNGEPTVIPDSELQDKRGRYYFTDIIDLPPGAIYVSPLDLNIERGAIERPFKPMIRIGSPVFDRDGVVRGVTLVNVLGEGALSPLASFSTETLGALSLFNEDGYWLYDSEREREWGFMLPERHEMTLPHALPEAAPTIYANDRGSIMTPQGLVTYTTIYPLKNDWRTGKGSPVAWHMSEGLIDPSRYFWKLVCLTPPHLVEAAYTGIERTFLLLGVAVEGTAVAILWLLSGSILRRKVAERRLRETNERLETTVADRTKELEQANRRLVEEMKSLKTAKETEVRLVAAIDQAVDSVVITDPEGNIVYTNPAFTRITGYTAEEALRQNPRLLNSGRHAPGFYETFWQTITAGEVWKGLMVNKKKSGALYEEEMSVAPVLNEKGKIMNFVAVKADVSRRVSLERAQSFFTSVTSHELRTPLTKLQLARLLLEQGDDSGRVKALAIIEETYNEFDRLVNATGTLSRLLLGETARLAQANLAAVLGASVGGARDAVRRNNRALSLNLTIEGNMEWISVPCDQELLALAIDEILSNAVKYSPDGSGVAIALATDKEAGTVLITVQDRGVGISENEIGLIKDPFFSFVDPSTYQSGRYRFGGGGIGLGLTLADLIVERHGGHLRIDSNTEGGGTIVTIAVPFAAPERGASESLMTFSSSKSAT